MATELWYVVNHFKNDKIVAGPFDSASDAGEFRTIREGERANDEEWNENNNLWVVSEVCD